MCGLVGIVDPKGFTIEGDLLPALKHLEYRGYDSAGYVSSGGQTCKTLNSIDWLIENSKGTTQTAIAHTRWATNGEVSQYNAHPHNHGKFWVVHNGIIENANEMREELEVLGIEFYSETDSEVIAAFIYQRVKSGFSVKNAIYKFYARAIGTWAVILMEQGKNSLYAFKQGSPLAVIHKDDRIILTSDIQADESFEKSVAFLEDGDAIFVDKDSSFYIWDMNIWAVTRDFKVIKSTHTPKLDILPKHFMAKEIAEQPHYSRILLNSLYSDQASELRKIAFEITKASNITWIAAGSSFHASMVGNHLLNQVGMVSHCWIASEFDIPKYIDDKSVAILVSQSGETMDVIEAAKHLKSQGVKLISFVNTPHSTVQRLSDHSIDILAGPEIAVAATKSYTNQVLTMLRLAETISYGEINRHLEGLSSRLISTIKSNVHAITQLAKKIVRYNHSHLYILGRGAQYSAALEMALKIKEVSYIHAEGLRAGELKHGTLALIEKDTPVIALIPSVDSEVILAASEVTARKGQVYNVRMSVDDKVYDNDLFLVPKCSQMEFVIHASVIGQLLAYHLGLEKELPIDKPRNLAKSVTVK